MYGGPSDKSNPLHKSENWQKESGRGRKRKIIKIREKNNMDDENKQVWVKAIEQMNRIMYHLIHSNRIFIMGKQKFDSRSVIGRIISLCTSDDDLLRKSKYTLGLAIRSVIVNQAYLIHSFNTSQGRRRKIQHGTKGATANSTNTNRPFSYIIAHAQINQQIIFSFTFHIFRYCSINFIQSNQNRSSYSQAI